MTAIAGSRCNTIAWLPRQVAVCQAKNRGRGCNGTTLLELVIAAGLMSIIATFFAVGIQWVRQGSNASEKAALLARFKNASVLLSRELSCAAKFLYPNMISQTGQPLLVFQNYNNEVVAVFLSPTGLVMYNYNKDEAQPLFPLATAFKARLVQHHLIEYEIEFQNKQLQFSFRNRLTPLNSLP